MGTGKVLVFGGVQDWFEREKSTMPHWVMTSEVFEIASGTWAAR
jgi:hypothetical protein